jgi:hypothetical protein
VCAQAEPAIDDGIYAAAGSSMVAETVTIVLAIMGVPGPKKLGIGPPPAGLACLTLVPHADVSVTPSRGDAARNVSR